MSGKSPGDLWEDIGSLDELEVMPVLTRLYSVYESQLENDPGNTQALEFFKHLETALAQAIECNLNRR
jgi:hypothetical protein